MKCHKCDNLFYKSGINSGAGSTWDLYRCPFCKQQYAMATLGGYIPDFVLKDVNVIILSCEGKYPQELYLTSGVYSDKRKNLFIKKTFVSHAGNTLDCKIECDSLTNDDIKTLAYLISKQYTFKMVYGIPRGGVRLALALSMYVNPDSRYILIVDDVLSTGKSMEEAKVKMKSHVTFDSDIRGVVIFSRQNYSNRWVTPVWLSGGIFI